ncbi:MAG: hypothetical protein CMJ18_04600 [Phycisphaeraceae bacterium]|nr:hypothetical protein [Phycisphaeraceae bacterium]
MKRILERMTEREQVIALITLVVAIGFLCHRYAILPAWDRWQAARSAVQLERARYARLSNFIAVREQVDDQLAQLDAALVQRGSNELEISSALKHIESLRPSERLGITRMQAMPVTVEDAHIVYRFRMSISASLPELVRFVADLTREPAATGIESFSLRGAPAGRHVECELVLRVIRLKGADLKEPTHG